MHDDYLFMFDDEIKRLRYFSWLELMPTQNFQEVKKAYRHLSKKYHPDKFTSNPEQEETARLVMQKLNEAYTFFEQRDERQEAL